MLVLVQDSLHGTRRLEALQYQHVHTLVRVMPPLPYGAQYEIEPPYLASLPTQLARSFGLTIYTDFQTNLNSWNFFYERDSLDSNCIESKRSFANLN
jgi:hypothetical protein